MSTEQWQELLDNNGWNNVSLRDARYNQVIHLVCMWSNVLFSLVAKVNGYMFTGPQVSAAQGAEDFYTTANNHTRQEPVELARKLDKITQQVSFMSHSYLSLITQ